MRLTTALLAILLVGCATPDRGVMDFDKRATALQPGMTTSQAAQLMGPPKNRQFSGDQEALQWCETSFSSGTTDSFVVAIFYDGRLVQTSTYRNSGRGYCESFFRPIEWVRPDRIIELRRR